MQVKGERTTLQYRDSFLGTCVWHNAVDPKITEITTPLEDISILLDPAVGCHVDHEGYDLNQIEQAYYKAHNVSLVHDPTLYKDGAGPAGTQAIIQPWGEQIKRSDFDLVIDHSHYVYRYPIRGAAAWQISQHTANRPELARLLAPTFKCGLDLCIDILYRGTIQPIVHIEWDYTTFDEMQIAAADVQNTVMHMEWSALVPAILKYNTLAKSKNIDAFTQADTRSQLLFGRNSYILVSTL